jgi:hypothetical protein
MRSGGIQFFPDVINALKDRKMGEDGKHPEDGDDATEQDPCGEKDDPFRPFKQSDVAGNSGGFSLSPGVGDENGSHACKGCENNEGGIPPLQVIDEEGKEEKEVGIPVEYGIEKTTEWGDLSEIPCQGAVQEVKESRQNDHQPGHDPVIPDNEDRGGQGCQEPHEGEKIGITTIPENPVESPIDIRIQPVSDFIADHLFFWTLNPVREAVKKED